MPSNAFRRCMTMACPIGIKTPERVRSKTAKPLVAAPTACMHCTMNSIIQDADDRVADALAQLIKIVDGYQLRDERLTKDDSPYSEPPMQPWDPELHPRGFHGYFENQWSPTRDAEGCYSSPLEGEGVVAFQRSSVGYAVHESGGERRQSAVSSL